MDADNPVVKLCAEGLMAEGQGRSEQARDLIAQAWSARMDPFEACWAILRAHGCAPLPQPARGACLYGYGH